MSKSQNYEIRKKNCWLVLYWLVFYSVKFEVRNIIHSPLEAM